MTEGDPAADACTASRPRAVGAIGLILGPLLALLVALLLGTAAGGGLSWAGVTVASVGVLMAVYWLTEAVPLPVTALFPIALLPVLSGGEIGVRQAAAPYAHEMIFLFMGGFMLALSMQEWGLHRRVALSIVLLVGRRPASVVLGFMLASAFLSMWISNTATVVMMLPIAAATAEGLGLDPLRLVVPATIAASCAFMMPVATPPNAIVFGSGEVTIGQMVRAGLWLNLFALVVIVALMAVLGGPVLGIR